MLAILEARFGANKNLERRSTQRCTGGADNKYPTLADLESLARSLSLKKGLGYFRWLSAFHALKNGRGNTHFPDCWIFSAFDLDCNTIGFWKWVGNDFQFFSVKAHPIRNRIA